MEQIFIKPVEEWSFGRYGADIWHRRVVVIKKLFSLSPSMLASVAYFYSGMKCLGAKWVL
jgi:hypothetical protein